MPDSFLASCNCCRNALHSALKICDSFLTFWRSLYEFSNWFSNCSKLYDPCRLSIPTIRNSDISRRFLSSAFSACIRSSRSMKISASADAFAAACASRKRCSIREASSAAAVSNCDFSIRSRFNSICGSPPWSSPFIFRSRDVACRNIALLLSLSFNDWKRRSRSIVTWLNSLRTCSISVLW